MVGGTATAAACASSRCPVRLYSTAAFCSSSSTGVRGLYATIFMVGAELFCGPSPPPLLAAQLNHAPWVLFVEARVAFLAVPSPSSHFCFLSPMLFARAAVFWRRGSLFRLAWRGVAWRGRLWSCVDVSCALSLFGLMVSIFVLRGRERGGGCTHFMHSRSLKTFDPRTPTLPGWNTSGFRRPDIACTKREGP